MTTKEMLQTMRWQDLPVLRDEREEKGDGWFRDIVVEEKLGNVVFEIWDIDNKDDNELVTQLLRYLACAMEMLREKRA